MNGDIALPRGNCGIVYGLVASDEPLQIRYIGQTTQHPAVRLTAHCSNQANRFVRDWINKIIGRGEEVRLRILGEYPSQDLLAAERNWIYFWMNYCELLNDDVHYKKYRMAQQPVTPIQTVNPVQGISGVYPRKGFRSLYPSLSFLLIQKKRKSPRGVSQK